MVEMRRAASHALARDLGPVLLAARAVRHLVLLLRRRAYADRVLAHGWRPPALCLMHTVDNLLLNIQLVQETALTADMHPFTGSLAC